MDKDFKKPEKLANPFLLQTNGIKPRHTFTPNGMLLPREMQPPPMYGPRGSTIPPQFLPKYVKNFKPHFQKNNSFNQTKSRDYELWCETCDRDFPTTERLQQHKSEHRKCGIEGCSFVGHPAVVTNHIEMQHKTGLFEKIKNLNTPEEIAKWRDERKKRFPTTRNVELRQKAQEEKFKRGERLNKPKNRFGKKRERSNFNQKNARKKNNRFDRGNRNINKNNQNKVIKEAIEIKVEPEVAEPDTNGNLIRFRGTAQLKNYKITNKQDLKSNPLASLLGMYGGSSDEETEPEVEIKSSSEEGELSSGEEPEEISIEKHTNITNLPEPKVEFKPQVNTTAQPHKHTNETVQKQPRKRNRKRRNSQSNDKNTSNETKPKNLLNSKKLKYRKPNTMLAKLLEPDVRHERNVLLQCVRFVVENNFFEIGSTNTTN